MLPLGNYMNAQKLKEICNIILIESKPKSICNHSLFVQNGNEIAALYDSIFTHLSYKPNTQKVRALLNELSREKEKGGITCCVCGVYHREDISQHVKQSHSMSCDKYRALYNTYTKSEKIRSDIGDRVKGSKNPAYQHGGLLSPFSNKFVKYNTLTEDEIIEKKRSLNKRVGQSNKENGNNDTTIIYWISKGFSEDEAREKIAERQATFSFEKCIEKYGVEDGIRKFNERQQKWQTTLNNLDENIKKQINLKKGLNKNGNPHIGGYFNESRIIKHNLQDKPCFLYYVKFYNGNIEFWKIGISMFGANKRFTRKIKNDLNLDIIFEKKTTVIEALKEEQEILSKFKDQRININYNNFKTTEAFSCNVLNK